MLNVLFEPTEENCGVRFSANYTRRFTSTTVPADGTQASVVAAIAAAVGTTNCVELTLDTTLTSSVTLTSGVSLISRNGSRVTGAGSILTVANSTISGIIFATSGAGTITLNTTTATSNIVVAGNTFTPATTNIAVYDLSTSNNTVHTGLTVERNLFDGCTYAVLGARQDNMKIRWNWCKNSTSRNIVIYGASNSLIDQNYINGGVTGITFLLNAQFNRFSATCTNNRISRNTVLNWTEEAISTDVYGNTPASVASVDLFSVISKSGSAGSSPSITVPRTALLSTSGYSVMWVTGTNAGLQCRSNFSATVDATSIRIQMVNNSLTSTQFTNITAGDIVVVGHCVTDSFIHDNYLVSSGSIANGIVCWGGTFRTKVYNNIVSVPTLNDAVRITSLAGLVASTFVASPNLTTANNCSPSSGCSVYNNTALSGRIISAGRSYQNPAGSYAASYSNMFKNNASDDVENESWLDNTSTPFFGTSSLSGGFSNNAAPSGINTQTGELIPESTLIEAGTQISRSSRDFAGRQRRRIPAIGAWDYATFNSV